MLLPEMDGHTKKGSYKVALELSGDQVEQLARLIEMAKMMDTNHIEPNPKDPLDIVAYKAFLQEILQILYNSVEGKAVKGV